MKDNFSRQADEYARYRPDYPPPLFDFIISQVKERAAAWDCATGNGQTAKALSPHFEKIFATDISERQLSRAYKADNIYYSVQPSEKTTLPDASINLITVSQALHWFHFDDFYKEVNRVSSPGAVIVVWCYSLLKISPEIDKLVSEYHFETLKDYWDAERKWVDEEYRSIPFPYLEIKSPPFEMNYQWTLQELEGYLNTWSALQKFQVSNGYSPVPELINNINKYWYHSRMEVRFPLHLKIAKVENK